MAAEDDKNSDFYDVLGLKKECSTTELKNAYKKLALRWHPDRCSSSGNSKHTEEAKEKFQAIQKAYSVLSDENKRFLYDVGVYDCDDDDDENGMGDFLNEMAAMMTKHKSNEKKEDSFEDLQELFKEIFEGDIDTFCSSSQTVTNSTCSSSLFSSCYEDPDTTNKRNSGQMNSHECQVGESWSNNFALNEQFCTGVQHQEKFSKLERDRRNPKMDGTNSGRRDGRKQKVSSGHDVSSNNRTSSASAS